MQLTENHYSELDVETSIIFKKTTMKTIKTVLKINLKPCLIILFLLVAGLTSCSKDDGPTPQEIVKSSDKQITSFIFLLSDNPLQTDVVATINEETKSIDATVPPDADVSNLLPEIKISKAASINKTTAQNFSEPVLYTVTAEDGSTVTYTVTLLFPPTQKDALQAIIDDNPDHTLDWDLLNTFISDLGNLDGVETDADGNITGLFLISKNIKEVSPEIALLSHLELLSLDGNPISTLPPEIGQLTALFEISLKGTQLTTIPAEIGFLTNLEGLLIEGNPLTTLPPEIGSLSNLRRLDLENNQITSLPPEMGFLSNLIFLFIEESNLPEIPISLAFLTTFNDFIGLSVLPPANIVSQKDALISIYSANPDHTLAWSVDNFPEIAFNDNGNPTGITMNNKNLSRIPLSIASLSSLESLNINGNNLESLPATIANINTLNVITAANNNLSTVPPEFGIMSGLALLSITDNPITSIPQEVCDLQTSNGGILTILTDPNEGCN